MNSFEKLGKMSKENMDIKLAPLSNILSIDINGNKGEVRIGIDRQTAQRLIDGHDFVGGLILADKKQFDAISN